MHCILHRWPVHKSHLRSRRLQLTVRTLCSISAFRVHEAAGGLDCKWLFNVDERSLADRNGVWFVVRQRDARAAGSRSKPGGGGHVRLGAAKRDRVSAMGVCSATWPAGSGLRRRACAAAPAPMRRLAPSSV
jgi:hypothetical protein